MHNRHVHDVLCGSPRWPCRGASAAVPTRADREPVARGRRANEPDRPILGEPCKVLWAGLAAFAMIACCVVAQGPIVDRLRPKRGCFSAQPSSCPGKLLAEASGTSIGQHPILVAHPAVICLSNKNASSWPTHQPRGFSGLCQWNVVRRLAPPTHGVVQNGIEGARVATRPRSRKVCHHLIALPASAWRPPRRRASKSSSTDPSI